MEMRAVYAQCLAELMEKDRHVCVLDADLAKASGTRPLYEKFPNQMFDCGVAEQDMASIAAGLSSYGFKPWIESFTPFATRRICDQIAISICYAKRNVKIVGTDPGIAAELNGGTHMSMEDIGVLRSIPGIVIFEPADPVQLRAAMPVLNDYDGAVYVRLFRKELPAVFSEDYQFDLFRADVLKEGKDLSVFATGFQLKDALEAADILAADGIDAEVINIHTIKPIDRETVIASARKTGAVLTVENHNVIGGLHSAVLEALAREKIPACAVGVQDRFGEVGMLPYLRKAIGLTVENIVSTAKEAVSLK
ncbi:MAG: transketolase family protein [Oscillospiraceae bacterium]|nr:transketolase family protein [Oscillospiraceae bacterium]MBP5167652.1 transketolase family protein [Oscillospiraceae bacterium]